MRSETEPASPIQHKWTTSVLDYMLGPGRSYEQRPTGLPTQEAALLVALEVSQRLVWKQQRLSVVW